MVSKEGQLLLGMKKRGFGRYGLFLKTLWSSQWCPRNVSACKWFGRHAIYRGLWQHSFCGKLEKGESLAEAAVRELEEECGLQVIDINSSYWLWIGIKYSITIIIDALQAFSQVQLRDLKAQGYFEYEFIERSQCPVTQYTICWWTCIQEQGVWWFQWRWSCVSTYSPALPGKVKWEKVERWWAVYHKLLSIFSLILKNLM